MGAHFMTRVKDWAARHKAVIEKHLALPSAYGVSDCYLICDDNVEAITGERMFPDIAYTSELGAAKLLLAHGFKDVSEAFASKFPEIPVSLAKRGDLGVIESDGQLCGGFFTAIGFACRTGSKLVFASRANVKKAFGVE